MKLTYPTETIYRTLAVAAHRGHRIRGRWLRVGLSFVNHCQICKRPQVITPAWYPWERDQVRGQATREQCTGV